MEELYGSHSLAFAEAAYSMEAQSVVENMLSSNGNFPSQVAVFSEHMFGSSGQLMSGSSGISDADSMVGEIKKGGSEEEVSSAIRAKIASHPLYPKLLQAYIDCQKVGAPPEIVKMLDDIGGESSVLEGNAMACLGADPELDHFMETYCEMLAKYKSDLSKPFDEATMFLNNIKAQLSHICNGCCEEEDISGEMESVNEEHDLKEKLMQKYSGYISSLKHEFSKKKKNGKLPKEAIQILLDWWNVHYKWPYPMEADKVSLAEATGLDQKQINNWFINQRKRHWRPSENMQITVMDSLYEPFCLFTNDP